MSATVVHLQVLSYTLDAAAPVPYASSVGQEHFLQRPVNASQLFNLPQVLYCIKVALLVDARDPGGPTDLARIDRGSRDSSIIAQGTFCADAGIWPLYSHAFQTHPTVRH